MRPLVYKLRPFSTGGVYFVIVVAKIYMNATQEFS